MSELDTTAAESKATYQEIQDYVKEHTGLHVSLLNIAQVKCKHGIIERENYYLSKSENSQQPNSTPEKGEGYNGSSEALQNDLILIETVYKCQQSTSLFRGKLFPSFK